MIPIEIRKANLNDIKNIVQLIIDGWNETYEGVISQSYLEDMKKNENEMIKKMREEFNKKNIIVATYSNEIVGFSEFVFSNELSPDLNIDCELCRLYIKKNYQRLGIGSKLYENIINTFKKAHKIKMGIWCIKNNIPAISFYEKKGARKIKETNFTLFGDNKIYEMVALTFNL